ncbi:MAG: CHAT domain-containing protein [Bacteroidetes bacterium]|nr:CHAT domain-containing protein [Bacteroidota bacterium]
MKKCYLEWVKKSGADVVKNNSNICSGAKNVLVSVKNVDDKATQVLMEYFYKNIANGNTYIDALRNAQLQMTNHPLFNDPKHWSNFILVGQ